MELLCIDRIEGSWAICQREDGSLVRLPVELLPEGAGEGDILRQEAQGYKVDQAARESIEQQRAEQLQRLFHRSNSGKQ